jgi:hypothetical protein
MATTYNTYTGNGSTVLYSFTFPYLSKADVKVSLDGVVATAYTLANATTIQFNTAPASGAAIKIYRKTSDANLAEFFAGSAIRSGDLNNNFLQGIYVSQETVNTVDASVTSINAAVATANSANSTANAISATANTALTNANAAVVTANAASTSAASSASTANSALTTANTASTNATAALTASTTATSTANTALSTANTASSNANSAINAVSSVVAFPLVAAVANIPASPTNGQGVQVTNSTGIQSFTPLAGRPAGFVGDSGINVKLQYTSLGSTWNWIGYAPNDSDGRYLRLAGGTLTGPLTLPGSPSSALQAATKGYVDAADTTLSAAASSAQTAANTAQNTANTAVTNAAAAQTTASAALPKSGGTMTGDLILVGAPTSSNMAATRAYVDSKEAFPATTALLFAQTTAPAGWTKSITHDNKALRVVSGTAGSGGSTEFTSVFRNRGVPLPEHSHVVSDPGHAHPIYDPGHYHGYQYSDLNNRRWVGSGDSDFPVDGNSGGGNTTTSTQGTGIGIYGNVTGIWINNAGTAGASMDFNVAYVDVIIATKN